MAAMTCNANHMLLSADMVNAIFLHSYSNFLRHSFHQQHKEQVRKQCKAHSQQVVGDKNKQVFLNLFCFTVLTIYFFQVAGPVLSAMPKFMLGSDCSLHSFVLSFVFACPYMSTSLVKASLSTKLIPKQYMERMFLREHTSVLSYVYY